MEAGKAYLRQTDADGISVYSHLTDVLATLLELQPANALEAFESTSLRCKAANYMADAVATGVAPPELPDPEAPVAPAEAWASATKSLLITVAKPTEDEPTGVVSDLLSERALFECAGAGLPARETYRVYASLVQLQKEKDLQSVRFFGKVLGVPTDYYIAEAVYNTPPEPEEGYEPPPPPPGAPVEEPATGCNSFVYFATNDPASPWTALPDVTPQQIVYSKRIRKYVTGDLEANVRAFPPFPGQEKAYLRALIARIVAAATLCPTGKYSLGEEEGEAPTEVELGEEGRTLPSASALGEVSGWCTRYMGILDIGRCTNVAVEEEAEEGEEKPAAPPPQPHIPYLNPITEADWTCTTYTHGGPPVAIARSMAWPGALCAYQLANGGVEVNASMYIGYGLERLPAAFAMEVPPPFEAEPTEPHEQADPPLEKENEVFLSAEKERLAEELANAPDEAAEE